MSGGTLTFGTDDGISGGVTVSAGAAVQVGTNGGTGTLPAGNVASDGSLIFDRGADLVAPNVISGAGSLTKNDANVLTLSGANTFTGQSAGAPW